jgi:ribose transport system ATP-binding protein
MPPADETLPVVRLDRVSKLFGPTHALREVSFQLHPGEVHVLAGENGAGKTTLIRILSGVYRDYSGTARIDGRPVRLRNPADAARAGIATIHQELSLVGTLSVADNLALPAPGSAFAPISHRRRRESAHRALALVDLDVDEDRRVEELPLAQRQLIEIARALAQRARVLILDEPTSALSEPEAELLFERILRLRSQGTGIIYISHRLEEMYRVGDRITVLRDGAVVASQPAAQLDQQQLVHAMVGRELVAPASPKRDARHEALIEVRGLSWADRDGRRPALKEVSCSLGQGEILGLFGLQGSGTSEVLQVLFGALGPVASTPVRLAGREHRIRSPRDSVARGVVLLSNDRRLSVLQQLSVLHNASLSSLQRFSPGGWVRRAREAEAVAHITAELKLSAPSLAAEAGQLSGGNQQKVALARCLLARPRVLLLDEPTRGIDIGAKTDVYALVRKLAGRGVGILLVASELEELIALCDSILVMVEGRVVDELARADFSRRRILQVAMGRRGEGA